MLPTASHARAHGLQRSHPLDNSPAKVQTVRAESRANVSMTNDSLPLLSGIFETILKRYNLRNYYSKSYYSEGKCMNSSKIRNIVNFGNFFKERVFVRICISVYVYVNHLGRYNLIDGITKMPY